MDPPVYDESEVCIIRSMLTNVEKKWIQEDSVIHQKYEQLKKLALVKKQAAIQNINSKYEHELEVIQNKKNQHMKKVTSARLKRIDSILETSIFNSFFFSWFKKK